MAAKFGVNVELYNASLAPYKINNERPIAIIGDDTKLTAGLYLYSDILEALKVDKRHANRPKSYWAT